MSSGTELARFHDDEAADDVWHEAAHLLEITNVVARQLRVGSLQFGRAKIAVAIEDLFGGEKFALGRGRQLKAPRRIDLVQLLQDPIAVRPFRLSENIETAEPGRERETDKQKEGDRPREEIGFALRTIIALVEAKKIAIHLWRRALRRILSGARCFERCTAAAGPGRVWIHDTETGAGEAVMKIESRAA